MIVLSLFFLPATFLHELCHFALGFITFANPTDVNLIPKKEGNEYTLGSVEFKNINFFNALWVGIAPLLLIGLLYFLDKDNFALYMKIYNYVFMSNDKQFNAVSFLLLVYINYILVYSGIPSSQDFRVIFSHIIGLIIWILILSGLIYYLFNKQIDFLSYFS